MPRWLLDVTAAASVEPPDILIVKTASQLLYALQNGYQDIELRAHMDVSVETTSRLLAHVFSSTRSIRVRLRLLINFSIPACFSGAACCSMLPFDSKIQDKFEQEHNPASACTIRNSRCTPRCTTLHQAADCA